jgi:hypothetical protein
MAFRASGGWPECGSEQSRSAVQRAVQTSSLPQMAKRVSLAAAHVFQPEPGITLDGARFRINSSRWFGVLLRGVYSEERFDPPRTS